MATDLNGLLVDLHDLAEDYRLGRDVGPTRQQALLRRTITTLRSQAQEIQREHVRAAYARADLAAVHRRLAAHPEDRANLIERLRALASTLRASRIIRATIAEAADALAQGCSHVIASDEGTQFCGLSVREVLAEGTTNDAYLRLDPDGGEPCTVLHVVIPDTEYEHLLDRRVAVVALEAPAEEGDG